MEYLLVFIIIHYNQNYIQPQMLGFYILPLYCLFASIRANPLPTRFTTIEQFELSSWKTKPYTKKRGQEVLRGNCRGFGFKCTLNKVDSNFFLEQTKGPSRPSCHSFPVCSKMPK